MKQNIGSYTPNYTKGIHNTAQIWINVILNYANNEIPKSACLDFCMHGKLKLIMEG